MNPTPTSTRRLFLICLACLGGLALAARLVSVSAQGSTAAALYLPVVTNGPNTGGSLAAGGTVYGPDGLGVGALGGTLSGTVDISMAVGRAPTLTLPASAQPLGSFYEIAAGDNVLAPTDAPFILAVPIPTGVPTANLALALHSAGEAPVDIAVGSQAWTLLEGQVDASDNLFLTTVAGLTDEGGTYLLISHPDFSSPANDAPAARRPALPNAVQFDLFNVKCVHFANPGDCIPATENAVADLLTDIYHRFKSQLGFKEPRLRYLDETLNFDPTSLSSLGFTAYIEPHDYGFCGSAKAGGYYDQTLGRLVLCLNPAVGLDPDYVHLLIHEYFHAVQFAYAPVLADFQNGKDEAWVIEGMAKAAEESYFFNEMIRSEIGGWVELHKVDTPMKTVNRKDEYFAQDFWVHYGQKVGSGMPFMISVLEKGAKAEDVVIALGDGQVLPPYWDWAKNQVMEKTIDFNGALGGSCSVEKPMVGQMEIFQHHWPNNPTHTVSVPPLSTAVVELTFSDSYDAGFGFVGAGDPGQLPFAADALGYKFYKEGESGCQSAPDGPKQFLPPEGIDAGQVYYVIISNTDPEDPYDYTIGFELTPNTSP